MQGKCQPRHRSKRGKQWWAKKVTFFMFGGFALDPDTTSWTMFVSLIAVALLIVGVAGFGGDVLSPGWHLTALLASFAGFLAWQIVAVFKFDD